MKLAFLTLTAAVSLAKAQLDFGDLPAENYGPDNVGYDQTASHLLSSALYLGNAAADGEATATPNATATGDDASGTDESILDFSVSTNFDPAGANGFAQILINTNVTNFSGNTAWVRIFGDFNQDGDFNDPQEVGATFSIGTGFSGTISTGFFVLKSSFPAGSPLIVPTRIRIGPNQNMGPTGAEGIGEVEDHIFDFGTIPPETGLDFGDFPDGIAGTQAGGYGSLTRPDYQTRLADNGPRHTISNQLFMREGTGGAQQAVDSESDGQPQADAEGDNQDGNPDDFLAQIQLSNVIQELASANPPIFRFRGTAIIPVTSFNDTGSEAFLSAWADQDFDGGFSASELSSTGVLSVPSSGSETTQNLTFPFSIEIPADCPPGQASLYFPIRVRLSTDVGLTAVGPASDGEVVDHLFSFPICQDFGDFPDSVAGTQAGNFGTNSLPDYRVSLADNGPRHAVVDGLSFSSQASEIPDLEFSASASNDALGDGSDEDGFLTTITSQISTVTSQSPLTARTDLVIRASLPVTNTLDNPPFISPAQARIWADFNLDGNFANDEIVHEETILGDGSRSEISFTINHSVTTNGSCTLDERLYLPIRARLSTIPNLDSFGPAPNGEVEDHLIVFDLKNEDFCDGSPNALGQVAGFGLQGAPLELITEDFIPSSYQSLLPSPTWYLERTPLVGTTLSAAQVSEIENGALLWAAPSPGATGIAPQIEFIDNSAFAQIFTDLGITGTDQAPYLDLDGDSLSTLVEVALGSDPTDEGSHPPVISRLNDTATPQPGLLYLRRTGGSTDSAGVYQADNISYCVEATRDLSAWNEPTAQATLPSGLPSPPTGYEWAFETMTSGTSTDETTFFRIKISGE